MTTRNRMVRLAVLGVATLALASCGSQASTKDGQALTDSTGKSKVAPTRTGYTTVKGARFYCTSRSPRHPASHIAYWHHGERGLDRPNRDPISR